ncbi:MAG: 2-amino-4-hydroxy-6-hydroxymethyldihydropteridine diphosphokinase [Balneolaceae bacterium]|nr:2-amino-4-hydroxy-6-hydroxymethyldihydropteridine diphosphokinase [Balneolaceae bacterium]
MARTIIALGSNLDNPHAQLKKAAEFLSTLSEAPIKKSSIYLSEPIGPSEYDFLNAAISIESSLSAVELFEECKKQELAQGRPSRYPKWTARPLDLDIIAYRDEIIDLPNLQIPHPEYSSRLFVLLPLQEVEPNWVDPKHHTPIETLLKKAPKMAIRKTTLNW